MQGKIKATFYDRPAWGIGWLKVVKTELKAQAPGFRNAILRQVSNIYRRHLTIRHVDWFTYNMRR